MATTAPTLTWTLGNRVNTVSPSVIQDSIDAIQAAVTASPDWEVISFAGNELEIGPSSGPLSALRVLIATGINAAQVVSPHTVVAGVLYMGIAPEGGTLGDAHGAGNPYGAARWSGFQKMSGDIDSNDEVNQVFVVTSAESIWVFLKEADAVDWFGGAAGALIQPPDDVDGDGDSGRIYGIISGGSAISDTLWGTTNAFVGGTGNSATDWLSGIFRPSDTSSWVRVIRAVSAQGAASPRYETEAGTLITEDVVLHLKNSPYNAVGVLRQGRRGSDDIMRTIIQNEAAEDHAIVISGNDATAVDALYLANV